MKICCVNLNKLMIQVNGMKFENIYIKNFRNFEDVTIDISNKNIFFGLDTFNKLGYKAKINTHTTSCINLFLDIYLYSEYRLIYC